MKIVVACDSFKGCMTSMQAAEQIENGLKRAWSGFEVEKVPMADGGEGTAMAICQLLDLKTIQCWAQDAYGKGIFTEYAYDEKNHVAFMDVASVIGLNMYPKNRRNPMIASSKGVGQMILDAVRKGAKKIVIGLGGSATNDGGMGILEALGAVFYDANRQVLRSCPYSLSQIAFIDKRQFNYLDQVEIVVAADVKNHLLGRQGATMIYGRQKGLFGQQLEQVEEGMVHFRDKVDQTFHIDMDLFEGSGAAGGIGGVLLGIFQGSMVPGTQMIMEYANLEEKISQADMIITGEGQSDSQTLYGKVPLGIARLAAAHHKPCLCFSGALADGYEGLYAQGMTAVFSTMDRIMSYETAIASGQRSLERLAFNIGRLTAALKGNIQ